LVRLNAASGIGLGDLRCDGRGSWSCSLFGGEVGEGGFEVGERVAEGSDVGARLGWSRSGSVFTNDALEE